MFNVIAIIVFFPWQYSVKNVPLFNHGKFNEQSPAGVEVAGEGSWSVPFQVVYFPLPCLPRCFTVLFLQQIPLLFFRLHEWPSALSPLSSDRDTGHSAKVDTLGWYSLVKIVCKP